MAEVYSEADSSGLQGQVPLGVDDIGNRPEALLPSFAGDTLGNTDQEPVPRGCLAQYLTCRLLNS